MVTTRYNFHLGHSIESLTSETHVLLQLLTDWSHGDATKRQIYDGYVNLAMAFIACSYALEENGVDMSTPRISPQHIFDQLERMLSLGATHQVRDTYLPSIRSSVQILLQDLRAKRRESYQRSRSRKRESLDSSSTASTMVEVERAKTLQCLNGQGLYRESPFQSSEVALFSHSSDSEDCSIIDVSESSSLASLDGLACDHGEKYVCGPCGTVCIEPIQNAVDSLTCTSLELRNLLEKWRVDPVLAVNLHLSWMRVSQDYDAAVEVFRNKGAYIEDLKPVVQELKTAVSKAAHFPYLCGHDELRDRILFEACSSVDQLNRGLKSRQRKYMLKHAPAIKSSVTHFLVCLKNLGKLLSRWSHGKVHRNCVGHACVVLDCAFKIVISAFYAHGVDVSDLIPSPSDNLNTTLQNILADEPSPDNWKKHEPMLGAIVKNILASLLRKNTDDRLTIEIWWSAVSSDEPEDLEALDVEHGSGQSMEPPAVTPVKSDAGLPQSWSRTPTLGHDLGKMAPLAPSTASAFRRGATQITSTLMPRPLTIHQVGPLVDSLDSSRPCAPTRKSRSKGSAIGTVIRRMSGRITSMFESGDARTPGRNMRSSA